MFLHRRQNQSAIRATGETPQSGILKKLIAQPPKAIITHLVKCNECRAPTVHHPNNKLFYHG
jgi:hypothetical protein